MKQQSIRAAALAACVACAVWFGSGTSQAALVTYTETGNFLGQYDPNDRFYRPPPVFTLDTGVNTFSGTVTGQHYNAPDLDFGILVGYFEPSNDLFKVTIPAGKQITQVLVQVFNYSAGIGTFDQFTGDVGGFNAANLPLGIQTGGYVKSGSASLTGGPLGPATYDAFAGGLRDWSPSATSVQYTFSMTVVTVPEPAAGAFLLAIAVPTMLRRRRKP
jgi:hypothetical protein